EENARLRALNDVKRSPRTSFVAAQAIGDSGGPFAQSAVVNVGREDGVEDGAPVLDAAGLVGRVVGVGARSARVVLLTDPRSRVPVTIGGANRRAILYGDADGPHLRHVSGDAPVAAGARVATSGDGAVFPAGLHIGVVGAERDGLVTVRPAADFARLDFVRIFRVAGDRPDPPTGGLILPASPATAAEAPAAETQAPAPETEARGDDGAR
ncbi:MAG: rod shape-determining protein MreC, partial [Pseudomonadota bacterium]